MWSPKTLGSHVGTLQCTGYIYIVRHKIKFSWLQLFQSWKMGMKTFSYRLSYCSSIIFIAASINYLFPLTIRNPSLELKMHSAYIYETGESMNFDTTKFSLKPLHSWLVRRSILRQSWEWEIWKEKKLVQWSHWTEIIREWEGKSNQINELGIVTVEAWRAAAH
jgi:hypothetical protein